MSNCAMCGLPLNKDDPSIWKEVRGWVGGPKKDSMRLRQDTGILAHDRCVDRLLNGQAPDQPELFEVEQDLLVNPIQSDLGPMA